MVTFCDNNYVEVHCSTVDVTTAMDYCSILVDVDQCFEEKDKANISDDFQPPLTLRLPCINHYCCSISGTNCMFAA